MERDIKIIYRVAEKLNKNNKAKPNWINNKNCLRSLALNMYESSLYVFGDRLEETKPEAKLLAAKFIETTRHGNAQTFLEVLDYAVDNLQDDDIVYFVEDDYVHKDGFETIIKEGLSKFDYISLYDHPDKYEYEPQTQLFVTKSTHWRLTGSTTMTFACLVRTLKFDYQIFKQYSEGFDMPQDYHMWQRLVSMGRKLATPIPGYATHGEIKYLAPVIDWEKEIKL